MNPTVVITTKNRKEELRVAVRSALEQTARPEVLVIDDGSTDGTPEMMRAEFPQARLERVGQSLGYIAQRNRGAQLATGDILFSIDDDAAFSTPYVIEQTLAEFDHPRVGAVAIPFINVKKEGTLHQRAPGESGIIVGNDYIGTAHALRRDLFLRLGGYRPYLFHQGEERDYCIRLLDAGYVVRFGRSDPIHHFESPRRDFRRMDLYGRRNDILYAWYNVPWPSLPVHLLGTTARGVMFGFHVHRPLRMIHGLMNGYGAMVHEIFRRQPVRRRTYQLSRRLKCQPLPLEQIEPLLPDLG
jgi:glycosyltransferase involved in cell wall biosynthesis